MLNSHPMCHVHVHTEWIGIQHASMYTQNGEVYSMPPCTCTHTMDRYTVHVHTEWIGIQLMYTQNGEVYSSCTHRMDRYTAHVHTEWGRVWARLGIQYAWRKHLPTPLHSHNPSLQGRVETSCRMSEGPYQQLRETRLEGMEGKLSPCVLLSTDPRSYHWHTSACTPSREENLDVPGYLR